MTTRSQTSRWVVPVAVLLMGLSGAWFVWRTLSDREDAAAAEVYLRQTERVAVRLVEHVEQQIERMHVLRDVLLMQGPITGPTFTSACAAVMPAPRDAGMRFVAWLDAVAEEETGSFLEACRREGHPDVSLHDIHGREGGAPGRSVAVRKTRPGPLNVELTGLDLATEPDWAATLEEAARADAARIGAATALLRHLDVRDAAAVLVALPVYDRSERPVLVDDRLASLAGFLLSVSVVQELVDAALDPDVEPHEPSLTVAWSVDGPVIARRGSETERAGSRGPPHTETLGIAGSVWHVAFRPAPGDLTATELLTRPSVVVPLGLIVTFALCAAIVMTLGRQNSTVQRLVTERTAELEAQRQELQAKEHELELANRRLLEMSHTDALTELLNRRGFEMQLDKERERAQRTGQPFGLLFFDVDHFKGFNDHYGHLAGDEALKRVAHIIQSEARRIDCVARYGGEEFVVIASNTDAHGLLALGERIRSRIRGASIENAGSPLGTLTISGGGSLYRPGADSDPRRVTEIADRCLYKAKSEGRNRVTMLM